MAEHPISNPTPAPEMLSESLQLAQALPGVEQQTAIIVDQSVESSITQSTVHAQHPALINTQSGPKIGGSVFVSVPVSSIPPPAPVPSIATKLESFWQDQLASVQDIPEEHWKTPEFPLARIKKIMRMDEDVRMISAEVPVMFSKAVELFIAELSMRAWQQTEESKRRTIQRSDIAMAITKNDMFDFLIDIVPREEIQIKTKPTKSTEGLGESLQLLPPDLLQLFIQHLTSNTSGEEEGSNSLLQNQLHILQQLLHIQQLQEQQEQMQSQTPTSTALPAAPPPPSTGTILNTQVLQTSDTQSINPDVLEQIRTQMSSSEYHQLLRRINTSELLDNQGAVEQQMALQSQQATALDTGTQFVQSNDTMNIRLDSLTHQVLQSVDPLSDANVYSSTASEPTVVQLPAEFGPGMEDQSESVATKTSSGPAAFKSTPLRLTHVHGSSSLVELSDIPSTTS